MVAVTQMSIRVRKSAVRNTGGTMTECAPILAAIAVAVCGAYRVLGNNIGTPQWHRFRSANA